MTYQEAAQNLITLYAQYIEICTLNKKNYDDFSEEITIAVEALLVRADNERMIAMQKEYLTNLYGAAPIPCDATIELLKQEDAFDKHFRMGDI